MKTNARICFCTILYPFEESSQIYVLPPASTCFPPFSKSSSRSFSLRWQTLGAWVLTSVKLCGDAAMIKCSPFNGRAETSRRRRSVTTLVLPSWGPSCCYVLCRSMRGNKVRRTPKQQINKLSLWQVLTIIDWQVILLTSVLAVGGQGVVSWDCDSDVLCTHWSVCSFATNSGVAAGHWCVQFILFVACRL